jgi:Sodium:sulfate symporter transmembrane region
MLKHHPCAADIRSKLEAVDAAHRASQGAVYIGSGYLALPDVFKYGALFSVINLTLWSVVGVFWWKALGLY